MGVSQISRDRRVIIKKAQAEEKKKMGICIHCFEKSVEGKRMCDKHLKKANEKCKDLIAKRKNIKKDYSGVEAEIVESIDDLIYEREPKFSLKTLQLLEGFKKLWKERVEAYKEDTRVIIRRERSNAWSRSKKFKAYLKEYNKRPEVKERIREYQNRPEIREKIRKASKKYRNRPEIKERLEEYRNRPEIKAKRIIYEKQYYLDNAEKKREYGRKYHEEHRELMNKVANKYYQDHKEEIRERNRKYYYKKREAKVVIL